MCLQRTRAFQFPALKAGLSEKKSAQFFFYNHYTTPGEPNGSQRSVVSLDTLHPLLSIERADTCSTARNRTEALRASTECSTY